MRDSLTLASLIISPGREIEPIALTNARATARLIPIYEIIDDATPCAYLQIRPFTRVSACL